MPFAYNDFSPGVVARMRDFASEIGGSDPFAEVDPAASSAPPPATHAAASPRPTFPPPARPTALDREFERIHAAALARQEVECQAEAAAAATFIINAYEKARA